MIRWAIEGIGPVPGLVLASVAALAVADRLAWQLWWACGLDAAPEGLPLRPFQALIGVTVAIVIAGALRRRTGTRLWALALLDLAMGTLPRA
jgi:hypothetical protein